MPPLVTCICPTMPSRREWLRMAIASFESQTYPEKELLIVGGGIPVNSFPADTGIRVIGFASGSLGDKRNFCCSHARGEIIVHFDDDDHSEPGRVADQVKRLMDSGKAVTGYRSMKFTDGENWWKNTNPSSWAFGTSLCYRRDWWQDHQFGNVTIGEDRDFVQAAAKASQLVTVDAGDIMWASNHPGNTSKRTIGAGWELCEAAG